MERVAVSGIGLELPGLAGPAALLSPPPPSPDPPRFAPEEKLGRTGLLYKDRATRLALCATREALLDAGLPVAAPEQVAGEGLGVVVSSNLGNLDTVCRVVESIHAASVKVTSPLDLPNASSNVIASTIAIRFGCRAVNLTVCNGATAGVDALHFAANAIRAGRARRIIVVGVEPFNPVVGRLMRESAIAWLGTADILRLGEGAGAVVLEAEGSALARGARIYGRIGGYGFAPGMDLAGSISAALNGNGGPPSLWFTPNGGYPPTSESIQHALRLWAGAPPRRVDLAAAVGETYGALGVLQAVAACSWLGKHGEGPALLSSGAAWGDGAASLVIGPQAA
ncbi:MAG TPA: beta-ketoacyl synthase N-terminal-like domain-containing protein [Vicinamibacteria bacterium]